MSINSQDLVIADAGDPYAKAWPIRLGSRDLRIDLVETERGYLARRPTSTCEYVSAERTYASMVLEDVATWLNDPWATPDLWTQVL